MKEIGRRLPDGFLICRAEGQEELIREADRAKERGA